MIYFNKKDPSMKIFVGRISPDLDYDMVYNHFKMFGEIDDFKFKGQYAFVEYKNDQDGERVLDKKEIEINGKSVIVEASNSRGRPRMEYNETRRDNYNDFRRDDSYESRRDHYTSPRRDNYYESRYDNDRRPLYTDNRPYNGHPQGYTQSGRFYDDRPAESYRSSYGYENGGYPQRTERDDCYHCSRCEIHGNQRYERRDNFEHKKPKREHPNDVNKIVIQNLPDNVELNDIDNFVKKNDFDFVFSRLTVKRNAAIVEMKDIETRDKAIAKMDGQEINGTIIHVREFRTSGSNYNSQSYVDNSNLPVASENSEFQNKDSQNVDIYSGLDN